MTLLTIILTSFFTLVLNAGELSQIKSLKFYDKGLPAKSVLLYLEKSNQHTAKIFQQFVSQINRKNETQIQTIFYGDKNSQEIADKHNLQFIPLQGQKWGQDFGEILQAEFHTGDPSPLIFNTNQHKEVNPFVNKLKDFLHLPTLNLKGKSNAGNYGGNIEVDYFNNLFIGNSAGPKVFEIFSKLGQQQSLTTLESSWLHVGHLDEYISFIKTNAHSCGQVIAIPSAKKALAILKNHPLEEIELLRNEPYDPFNIYYKNKIDGMTRLFINIYRALNDLGAVSENIVDQSLYSIAKTKIKEFLLVDEIIARNIRKIKNLYLQENKICPEPPIIEIPNLYVCGTSDSSHYPGQLNNCRSFLPNAINMTVLDTSVIIPHPLFMPFKEEITELFAGFAIDPYFLPAMYYHVTDAGIHCGTYVLRDRFNWD